MSEPVTDLELVRRIAGGDGRALEALYTRHGGRAFKFLMRLTQNRAAAEDLTHDVFLEVWRGAKRFEGRSSVSTWLLSIARHKALDAMRRQRLAPEQELQTLGEPSPEALSIKASTGAYVRECMGRLSAEHREIIDLVYFHEKSIKEIAIILGIPANTVKTRMFYARQKLKEMLLASGEKTDVLDFGR